MVAYGVTGLGDLLEPGNTFLLEGAAEGEAVQHAARRLDAPARLDRVLLRLVVEVALFVVPMSIVPPGEVARHLQVKRDGDEGLAGVGMLCQAGRFGEEVAHACGAGQETAAGEERAHGI